MHGPSLHVLPPFFDLLALSTILGVLSTHLWVLPRSGGAEEPASMVAAKRRLMSLLSYALVLLTVTSAAILVARAAEMSGQSYSSVPQVLPIVLFKTHYGAVWFLRPAALLVLWLGVLAMRRTGGTAALTLTFAAGAAIAWTYSATGHAADQGDFTLLQAIDWLHILAVSVWGGGLLAVTFAIRPALINSERQPVHISEICHRLSRLAGFALAVVLVTGSYSVWRHIPGFAALRETVYGRLLSVKLFLVLTMILLGAINRYVILPRLRLCGKHATPSPFWFKKYFPATGQLCSGDAVQSETDLVRQFYRRVTQEAVLMVIVLGCVAFLIHSPPPGPMQADIMRHDRMHMSGVEKP